MQSFYTRVAKKEKTDGVSEEFLPKPLMGSTDYNSGLENFVESYDFFSVGISQERFVGLRQSLGSGGLTPRSWW